MAAWHAPTQAMMTLRSPQVERNSVRDNPHTATEDETSDDQERYGSDQNELENGTNSHSCDGSPDGSLSATPVTDETGGQGAEEFWEKATAFSTAARLGQSNRWLTSGLDDTRKERGVGRLELVATVRLPYSKISQEACFRHSLIRSLEAAQHNTVGTHGSSRGYP